MKTNEKLNELTKLFQQEIPELVRLEFGTRVNYSSKEYIFVEDDDVLEHRLFDGKKTVTKKRVLTKIIGKDITFEDVLHVIEKTCSFMKGEKVLFLSTSGTFYYIDTKTKEYPLEHTNVRWQPKTPLHLQKPEVWDLLYKVLIEG